MGTSMLEKPASVVRYSMEASRVAGQTGPHLSNISLCRGSRLVSQGAGNGTTMGSGASNIACMEMMGKHLLDNIIVLAILLLQVSAPAMERMLMTTLELNVLHSCVHCCQVLGDGVGLSLVDSPSIKPLTLYFSC